jgi:hypothetical protein
MSRRSGETETVDVAASRSDHATYFARRLVRHEAATVVAYCILVDATVRRDGLASDAFVLECGTAGVPNASRLAQRYEKSWRGPRLTGAPFPLDDVPSQLDARDPFDLDWGAITPDLVIEEESTAVHVVTHALEKQPNVTLTARFLEAKTRHFARHLPSGFSQIVVFDDRGQVVSPQTKSQLRQLSGLAAVTFRTDGGT